MQARTINLSIKSKDANLFTGDVLGVTAYNDLGIFDVLPMHSNFISLIHDKVITHTQEASKEFKVGDNAVMKVQDGKIDVYLGL